MKKLIYLIFILFSLIFISCKINKEEPLEYLYDIALKKGFEHDYNHWITLIEKEELKLFIYEDYLYYSITDNIELISIEELFLKCGSDIEYRYNDGILEWKYLGNNLWNYLASFKDLAKYYNVSFSDGITNQVVKEGECITKPSDVKKEGYIFNGWYCNGEQFDFNTQVFSDLYIEASWINILDLTPNKIEIVEINQILIIGYSIQLNVQIEPISKDYELLWSVDDEDIATITQDGMLTGLKEGNVKVRVESKYNNKIYSTYTFEIKENYYSNCNANLGGYEIIIMTGNGILGEIDPFRNDYTFYDKEYRQKAWEEVENVYNCKIIAMEYPLNAPWGDERIKWLKDNSLNNKSECDLAVIPSNWIPELASNNVLVDVLEYYNKYCKDEMIPFYKEISTYKDGLYACTDYTINNSNFIDLGLYYNVAMMEKYNIEDPAIFFNNDKWNYNEFTNWVIESQAKLPKGMYILGGHPYYYLYGLTNAAGIKLADTVLQKTNISHQKVKDSINLINNLYNLGCVDNIISWAESDGGFVDGTTLMTTGMYWFINNDSRWSSDMFEHPKNCYNFTSYGYVPFPYPNDLTKEDTRYGVSINSIITYIKGRNYTNGISFEDIYCVANDLFYLTNYFKNNDKSFNEKKLVEENIKNKVSNVASVEALLYMDSSKGQYDPAHAMYSSTSFSDLTELAIETMYENNVFDNIYQIYNEKFNEIFNDFFNVSE